MYVIKLLEYRSNYIRFQMESNSRMKSSSGIPLLVNFRGLPSRARKTKLSDAIEIRTAQFT
jgi:hypothetical protein